MSTSDWSSRSVEQARLFNPAFLAALIWCCSIGYHNTSGQGLPYPLPFVVVPVVLHKSTRESLPTRITTSLTAWLGDNPHVHICFAERALSLVPLVKEAVLFGVNGQLLSVSSSQIIPSAQPPALNSFLNQATDEVRNCMKKASFVGRWFANSGDYTTVMALWGIMP